MGKIIIQGSGGGGLDPDEITARASDVLKGKTTIDSDGEVVEGAIERRGTGGENALKIGKNSDSISVSFSAGYYENGNSNDAMPYVKVPYSLLSQTLDIDASKILETYTVAGVKGAIRVSKTNKNHVKTMNEGFAWSDDRGLMYVIRTDDNYYIPPVSEGGYNYVGVAEPDLKPENIITGKTIGRVKGSIPVKGGTSHNTNGTRGGYDPPSQRFYCDIERGAYINNCWSGYPEIGIHRDVFIQNLGIRPEMLRQGYSLFGVQGTLPDYASGRVVFNGATFDGVLVSGVADNNDSIRCGITCSNVQICYKNDEYNKHFGSYIDRQYDVNGIRDGGLNVYVRNNSTNRGGYEDLKAGYILKESVNLTPFRRIKIGYKILNPRTYTVDDARNGNPFYKAHLTIVLGIMSIYETDNNTQYAVEFNMLYSKNNKLAYKDHFFSNTRNIREGNGTQQYLEIDISDKQGHFYIGFGAGAEILYDTQGSVIFNHIEFIN